MTRRTDQQHEDQSSPREQTGPLSRLRDLAGKALGETRLSDLQDAATDWRSRAEHLRTSVKGRADEHLEHLIEQKRSESGRVSPEVDALLEARRQERVAKAEQLRHREQLLSLAQTADERRVLSRVAEATAWAGGPGQVLRYTALLDQLAPSGDPAREMAVHRAIWSLAERRVLAVSPHGEVTASLPTPRP